MSDRVPYRIELRTTTEAELSALNEERARLGLRPFGPVNEEMFEIDLTIKAEREDLERWLTHPDDRVFMACLNKIFDNECVEAWTGLRIREAHALAVRAAIDRAAKDGLVWTTPLNATYNRSVWNAVAAADAPFEDLPTPREYVKRLVPWLERETSEEALTGLLHFENPLLRVALARYGGHLSFDLVKLLAAKHLLQELAANPALTGPALTWITCETIKSNTSTRDKEEKTIAILNERGVTISDRVFRATFLDRARRIRERGKIGADAPWPGWNCDRLLKFKGLSLEQLKEIAAHLDCLPRDWIQIRTWLQVASHPNADMPLIRKAYEAIGEDRFEKMEVLKAIVKRRDVLSDPFFRGEYRRQPQWFLRFAVIEDLTNAEIDAIVDEIRLIKKPDELRIALQASGQSRIPQRIVTALLEHPQQDVRLEAISALSTVRIQPNQEHIPNRGARTP